MSFPRYPAYKPSGVEWLGEVPEHWTMVAPKRLMKSCSGGTLIKGECVDEPADGLFPAFSASGQDVWVERPDYERDGLVLSAVGARCGKTFKADGQWGVVANTHCLFPSPEQVRDFFWYLTNREDWWEKGGTAQPFVKVKETLDRPWCLPPPGEQLLIATFLDRETAKIDALIAEQQRLIELLQEKRQAVISHAVTKGLNPDAPMKDSGVEWLGEVPEHWDVIPLKHLTEIKAGFAFKSDDFIDNGVPVLRIGDIGKDGTVDFRDAKYLSHKELADHSDVLVKQGDIVMAMTGATIGKAARYLASEPALLNQRVCIFRAKSPESQDYVWFALATYYYTEYLAMTAFGGAQPNISDSELVACKIPVPPVTERVEISKRLSEDMVNMAVLENQAQRAIYLLQERRSALISAAVTGQIDVRGLVPEANDA